MINSNRRETELFQEKYSNGLRPFFTENENGSVIESEQAISIWQVTSSELVIVNVQVSEIDRDALFKIIFSIENVNYNWWFESWERKDLK